MTDISFSKCERITSRKAIEDLFAKGRSKTIHPIRMVHRKTVRTIGEAEAMLLISVPKRHFKRAVKRNRIKRQIREAYRHSKRVLCNTGIAKGQKIEMAMIWQSTKEYDTKDILTCVSSLLSYACR